MKQRLFAGWTGFQWDVHNAHRDRRRHEVECAECEETLFNRPFVVTEDVEHSVGEPRFYALGRSDAGRLLFIAFTIRGRSIRVISARDMSRRERRAYEEQAAQDT